MLRTPVLLEAKQGFIYGLKAPVGCLPFGYFSGRSAAFLLFPEGYRSGFGIHSIQNGQGLQMIAQIPDYLIFQEIYGSAIAYFVEIVSCIVKNPAN